MKNEVQLIAYANRLGGATLRDLHKTLSEPLQGLFSCVHILPFFFPTDGADAGFDPIDHGRVDPALGTWDDIRGLSRDIDIAADLIVNHISVESNQFKDYRNKGEASEYAGMFLRFEDVFPQGATERELNSIYRPRLGLPFTKMIIRGEPRLLWTTFTGTQADINLHSRQGWKYLENIVSIFAAHGISVVRLDAVGYAYKKRGTSCFMVPETFGYIDELSRIIKAHGMEVLVEIHSHYRQQIAIARQVDWVYDFALPPLILHALFKGTFRFLKKWLEISPRNAITVLDTHDGIGVIDVGPEVVNGERHEGLLSESEISELVDTIHLRSGNVSRQATGAAAANLDLYQVNSTFFDALGRNDREYLLARALQFFAPGIPQVYYVGLLAGENDLKLLQKTNNGRDINRRFFTGEEVWQSMAKPAVRGLVELIRLRNTHPAFHGEFSMPAARHEHELVIRWNQPHDRAELLADLSTGEFTIAYTQEGQWKTITSSMLLKEDLPVVK
ncbi:MAG: sucrose phosphorylase [Anaerolineales bacterium]|nr:sucrose phosphorylase [Anaerolineales bacterium]